MATSKRGFASMDAAKQREIASKGGRAAHAKGTAHEFTSDEARVAGRKGGEAVSRDRAHMAAIGREGGHSRGARARAAGTTGNVAAPNVTSPRSDNEVRTDFSQGTGSQPFVRQVNDERSGFENPSGRGSASGGYGSQERSRQDRDRENATDSPISNRDRF